MGKKASNCSSGKMITYLSFEFPNFAALQLGSFRFPDRPQGQSTYLNLTQRRCAVKPVNAEPKRNDSIVPLAATIATPGKHH